MKIVDTEFGKVIVMDFVDAEHCGMTWDNLQSELEMTGEQIVDDSLPLAAVIQVDGGFVVTKETSKDYLKRSKIKSGIFANLINSLGKKYGKKDIKDIDNEFDRIVDCMRTQGDIDAILDLIPTKEKLGFINGWHDDGGNENEIKKWKDIEARYG